MRWPTQPLQPLQKTQAPATFRFIIHASQQLTSPIVSYFWNFRHRLVRDYWFTYTCQEIKCLIGASRQCSVLLVMSTITAACESRARGRSEENGALEQPRWLGSCTSIHSERMFVVHIRSSKCKTCLSLPWTLRITHLGTAAKSTSAPVRNSSTSAGGSWHMSMNTNEIKIYNTMFSYPIWVDKVRLKAKHVGRGRYVQRCGLIPRHEIPARLSDFCWTLEARFRTCSTHLTHLVRGSALSLKSLRSFPRFD